jgi:hypothetical protein
MAVRVLQPAVGTTACIQDPAEVAEADGGVDPLGHLRRLQARRLASAVDRVVEVGHGERGGQPAAPGVLECADVVDPAVSAEIEGHGGGDAPSVAACDQDVEGVVVAAAEQVR